MRLKNALLAVAVWGAVAAVPYVVASKTVVIDVVDTAPNFFRPDVTRVPLGSTVVFSLGHDHGTGAAHTRSRSSINAERSKAGLGSFGWAPLVAALAVVCLRLARTSTALQSLNDP